METKNNANSVVAQGAAEWKEKQKKAEQEKLQQEKQQKKKEREALKRRQEEERQRQILNVVKGPYLCAELSETVEETWWPYATINIYKWITHLPSDDVLQQVMDRGRHEEIMPVIENYTKDYSFTTPDNLYQSAPTIQMPEFFKTFIAQRGNKEEIRALCRTQGFGADGQDILLERGDHEELMWYLPRHGFLRAQQQKLINRGNLDEIRTHIKYHGLAKELMDELLDEIKRGKTDNFYKFIAIREFPQVYQKPLLEVMASPEFYAYIDRYGFWADSLKDLVKLRSDIELEAYIKKHHFLGSGIYPLAKRSRKLIKLYMQEGPLEDWISILTSVEQPDYELLTEVFLKVPCAQKLSQYDEELLELFRNGTHEQVMAFLKENSKSLYFTNQVKAELFFRNNPVEFEYYLDCLHNRPPRR